MINKKVILKLNNLNQLSNEKVCGQKTVFTSNYTYFDE